jgi:hypothetical protein
MTIDPQTWHSLLRAPQSCDHLIQLYTDGGFFTRAVGEFLETGFAAGAGAVVIATPSHVEALTARLTEGGFDVPAALARGQLVFADARRTLARFMVGGAPERDAFFTTVLPMLDGVRAAGYRDVRAFGEMVNLLWDHNLPATVALEALWNEVLADRRVSLLCAYRIDNFDREAHHGALHQISQKHSHLIPVEDYARLESAVSRAYADVFGSLGEAELLREQLVSRHVTPVSMPEPQTALVALRSLSSDIADAVLTRARHHYHAVARASTRSS